MSLLEKIRNHSAVVGVVGLGYVGLPLAVLQAKTGFRVYGIDEVAGKVERINRGENYISDVEDQDLRDVVIVLSDRSTTLTGLVHDARGTPVTDVSVLVFADDRRLLPGRARWIKPDHLGTFVASGLPAGTYLVALAAQVDDLRWSTAEYLNAFRDQAMRVTLGDAGTTSITLRWSDQP